jgi:hypothetical protein
MRGRWKRRSLPQAQAAGFLMPLSAAASMVLLLSSVSLQAAALQARSQVQAGQRLRVAEDQLMSAAQQFVAERLAGGPVDAAPTSTSPVGAQGQLGDVAYRVVAFDGPHWQAELESDGRQRGRATATLELLPGGAVRHGQRGAFALELVRAVTPQGPGPEQLLALRELGLRGRAAAEVTP